MAAAASDTNESRRLGDAAEQALGLMREAGFDAAQASASAAVKEEINVSHNQPSLMRSTETAKLALTGIVDGRKASTEFALDGPGAAGTDGDRALRERIAVFFAGAKTAPQDDANAVSSNQTVRLAQGPLQADPARLADSVTEILAFREREAPQMLIDEAFVAHNRRDACALTTGGSRIECRLGWYEISTFGTARDGKVTSSFAVAGGTCDSLDGEPVVARFGIADMLKDTVRQIHTRPLGARFTGDVILTPNAVTDLVTWLLGQLDDPALIGGTSLFLRRVGERVASPLISLASRFDAPGIAAVSADAFAAPPVEVLRGGVLRTLLPSLYGSLKTGLPHMPVAAGGWEMAAGETPRAALVEGAARGAVVGRLSMGRPASNGDFSGVIKNSFEVEGGAVTGALSETMISGNVARMLEDVIAVSRERVDYGAWRLPFLRIGGLHFS